MDALGPILQIRQALLDETSPSDLRAAPIVAAARSAPALQIGQLVDARIVALSDGGALAQIGSAIVNLQLKAALNPGQEVRLQVLSNQAPLQFRLVGEAAASEAEDSAIELSGALPQLITSDAGLDGSGRNAPTGWPHDLDSSGAALIPHQSLVDLFETAVRELLQDARLPSSAAASGLAEPAAAQATADQAIAANPAGAHNLQAQVAPGLDPRFLAFVGWAWPEQPLEIEVDQRSKHPALDEYMRRCVISLRLTLPRSGRIETVLTSTTAGLNLDIEAVNGSTAERLRADSGDFIDLLRALDIRVGAMVVRHV